MLAKSDLQQQMKDALKAKDMVKLGVVRFLIAEIRNWEIDNGEASESDVQAVIKRQVKQLKDGIAEFEKAGRTDLVDQEVAKLQILENYLPAQMSDDALAAIVTEVLSTTNDKSMGSVMKAVMAKVAGQADGSRVSAEVKKQLTA